MTEEKQPELEKSLYEKTLDSVSQLKEQNDRMEALISKQETMRAEDLLGGRTSGNVPAPVVDPEDEKKAAAKEFFKGTQLERAIDQL